MKVKELVYFLSQLPEEVQDQNVLIKAQVATEQNGVIVTHSTITGMEVPKEDLLMSPDGLDGRGVLQDNYNVMRAEIAAGISDEGPTAEEWNPDNCQVIVAKNQLVLRVQDWEVASPPACSFANEIKLHELINHVDFTHGSVDTFFAHHQIVNAIYKAVTLGEVAGRSSLFAEVQRALAITSRKRTEPEQQLYKLLLGRGLENDRPLSSMSEDEAIEFGLYFQQLGSGKTEYLQWLRRFIELYDNNSLPMSDSLINELHKCGFYVENDPPKVPKTVFEKYDTLLWVIQEDIENGRLPLTSNVMPGIIALLDLNTSTSQEESILKLVLEKHFEELQVLLNLPECVRCNDNTHSTLEKQLIAEILGTDEGMGSKATDAQLAAKLYRPVEDMSLMLQRLHDCGKIKIVCNKKDGRLLVPNRFMFSEQPIMRIASNK